jgi:apolipoprotein N-acyltransferase
MSHDSYVETRRWLVRASNSGVSAFIDPTGEVVASIPLHRAATLTHSVQTSATLTPYVRFGNWIVGLSALVVIFYFATVRTVMTAKTSKLTAAR